MKKKIIYLVLSFISMSGFAQKKNSADYAKNIKEANLLILELNYTQALKYLHAAYHIDSMNANINYKLGQCYLETSGEKHKALKYLEKASENVSRNFDPMSPTEKTAPVNTYRLLGIAYRLRNQMNESNTMFDKYKEYIQGAKNKELTADLDHQIGINLTAIDYLLDQSKIKIVSVGDSINTAYPEYNPVVNSDESTLFFTSRRPGGASEEKTDEDLYFEDIYMCAKKKDGSWDKPKSVGSNINSTESEAVVSISADSRQMFVCRDINKGDIYVSIWDDRNWGNLIPLGSTINTKNRESFATMTRDGNKLYFVSNRKDGGSAGGDDIWTSTKLPDGSWGVATNLGPVINTVYDEESPYISPDGNTLYFSSQGHKNMGGFDIFKSVKDKNGDWSEPENLRPPFNSTEDDIDYMQSADGKHAYLASVRPGGRGDLDLYMINLEKPEDKNTIIKGTMTFDGTKNVPDNVHIVIKDPAGSADEDITPNKSNGSYIIVAHPGKNGKKLTLDYEANGFQPKSETIEVPANTSYDEIEEVLELNNVNLESKTSGTMNITGTIKDVNGKPIANSQVVVKNNLTKQLISSNYTTADSGSYYFILKSGENYNLSFEAEGYLFQSANINIPKNPDYSVISKNIILDKLSVGAKIVLNNIFFDSNKATLRPESNIEIEKLFDLLKRNPTISIEVQGHTDNKGNAAANILLSQNRAQAIVNELIKRGIESKRLTAKGFGSTMPLAPNTLPNGKPDEAGMQLNRRVEIKISTYP